jgi:hypothetical protein
MNDSLHDNPLALVRQVKDIVSALHLIMARYDQALRLRGTAEFNYELAKAEAYVAAEGQPAHTREAISVVKSAGQFKIFLEAKAREMGLKERLALLKGELIAAQSLLATERVGWDAATATQKYGT